MTTYPFVQAFHDLGPAKGPRLALVHHMAEGGGTVGYLSRANPNGVSVHFVIETSGRTVQMLRLDHMHSSIRTSDIRTTNDAPYTFQGETVTYGRTAAKAALGAWADIAHGTLGPNHSTIAVEVEGFAASGPNTSQTAAIAALARDLGLPAALGHRDFADYKACPGHRFPWPSAGGHGPTQETEVHTTITEHPFGGTYTIPADTEVTGFDLKPDGTFGPPKVWEPRATPSSATYDATVITDAMRGNPFIRADAGYFAGYLLSTASVQAEPPIAAPAPQPSVEACKPYSDAAVKTAVAADRLKAYVGWKA